MNRLRAGLLTGAIGAIALIILGFVPVPFAGILIPILVGVAAGWLVAKNPAYASRTGHAGALAGLLAGVLLLVGVLIGGFVLINTPVGQSDINAVVQTAGPSLTATATAAVGKSGGKASPVDVVTLTKFSFLFGDCYAGALYLGIATGLGALSGMLLGRNNQRQPAM